MRHVGRVLEIYTRKTAVRLFILAFIACVIWWLQILPIHEDHKWDAFMGVVAAIIAVLLEQFAGVISKYRRFYPLGGHYKCKSFADEDHQEACRVLDIDAEELDRRLAKNPDLLYLNMAQATIEYRGGAVLHIVLREGTHNNQWSGDCVMESDSVGIMAWAYDRLGERSDPWARNGIKRLSVVNRSDPIKICLHSYNNDGRFGRELMIKDDYRTRQHTAEWGDDWPINVSLICGGILALAIILLLGR